jgi:drug/metabolite transporter (DMT)-like permease
MFRSLPRQFLADLALLLVALIWGSTFVLVKEAVSQVKPFNFIALRFALATLFMALLFGRRLRTLGRRELLAGALIGLFLTAGYGFQTAGLQYTTASKAGFITGLSVVIVPFAAWLILGPRPTPSALAGVILATIGLALLSLQMGESLKIEWGDLLVLGCAVSFALHIVTVGAFAPRMDPLALTMAQIGVAALISGALALTVEGGWSGFSGRVWFAALFTGLLATSLAFAVQTTAQAFTTPTHTALIFATEPVFAALFGTLLAGERLTGRALLGCGLILAGMVVAELRISPTSDKTFSKN